MVGHLRRSPALFIEGYNSTISEDVLKESIIQRLQNFNARAYTHERITDKKLISIVDEGVLPRTVRHFNFFICIDQAYSTH